MSAAEDALGCARTFLEDARDSTLDADARLQALDRARGLLLEARRARAPVEKLRALMGSIMEVAANDTNQHARALVGQVAEDLCMRDIRQYAVPCTMYLEHALGDSHVVVVKRIIRALTMMFRKVMGLAVSLGVGPSSDVFPEQCLRSWLEMERRAVGMMNTNDFGVQKAACKFAETVVLALTYSGGRPTPEHFTLDYALQRRLNHPLLLLDALESEGRRVVAMVSGYIYKNLGINPPPGLAQTQAFVPSVKVAPASLVTAFSVIGNLVKRREKILGLTIPPLVLAVRGISGANGAMSPLFSSLPEGQRWTLIKQIKYTLKACLGYPHISTNSDVIDALTDIKHVDERYKHDNQVRLHRQYQMAKREAANRVARHPPSVTSNISGASLKRPRAPEQVNTLRLVPPQVAWEYTQFFISRMPPNEVAHFVMTRLILDTPPLFSQRPTAPSVPPEQDPRARKRARKVENEAVTEAPRRPVRRHAPSIVALKLPADGATRLLYRCCKSLLAREVVAKASGAGELRNLVLGRLLARIALTESFESWKLCSDVMRFVVNEIESRRELALAWLHAVLYANAATETVESMDDAKLLLKYGQLVKTEASVLPNSLPVACDARKASMNDEGVKVPTPTIKEELVQQSDIPKMDESTTSNGAVDVDAVVANGKSMEVDESRGECTAVSVKTENENADVDDDAMEDGPAGNCKVYERLLMLLLEELIRHEGSDPSQVRRMIVEAPILPKSVIEMLRDSCRDVEKNELALGALRDIILERYGMDRGEALEIVLALAVDADDVIRGPTIRLVADRLYCELRGTVPKRIEAFAIGGLMNVIESSCKNSSNVPPELEHRSWLATALCAQKHQLLHRLADGYLKAGAAARIVLLNRVKLLSSQLGTESTAAVELIGEGADGTEEFALTLLNGIVAKYGRPAPPFVEAACRRFSKCANGRFLEAVLSGMNREVLLRHLGDLVSLAEVAAGGTKPFTRMFRVVMESQPPALSAADLLVALHALPKESPAETAIRACFELKAIFKHAVVAQALQMLVEQTALSPWLMCTVLLTRMHYEDVDAFLSESIVVPMIRKKMWNSDELWGGFLEFCSLLKERSVKILLRLPVLQLEDAFDRKPALVENFRTLVANQKAVKKIPVKQRKAIANALSKSKS